MSEIAKRIETVARASVVTLTLLGAAACGEDNGRETPAVSLAPASPETGTMPETAFVELDEMEAAARAKFQTAVEEADRVDIRFDCSAGTIVQNNRKSAWVILHSGVVSEVRETAKQDSRLDALVGVVVTGNGEPIYETVGEYYFNSEYGRIRDPYGVYSIVSNRDLDSLYGGMQTGTYVSATPYQGEDGRQSYLTRSTFEGGQELWWPAMKMDFFEGGLDTDEVTGICQQMMLGFPKTSEQLAAEGYAVPTIS